MSERRREGEWRIARDKFSGKVRDIDPAFGESTSKGGQRRGTKTTMQTKTEAKREQQEQERKMVMEKEVLAIEWGETRTKDQSWGFWIR